MGHENVPREVENIAYADFCEVKEVYHGICAIVNTLVDMKEPGPLHV